MGRPSHSRALSVWANGVRVGTWTIPTRGPMELRYDEAWVASSLGRPLSLSLPFTVDNQPLKGPRVLNYFDNLLPDSETIRKRVAERFRTGSTDPFDLLKAVGRDCIGAVQLLGDTEEPERPLVVQGTPLSDADIESYLSDTLTPRPFGQGGNADDDLRISLAGAQEKGALLYWDGKWMRPHGATPTTHILKLPLGRVGGRQADFTTSVDNEWLCMKLLAAFGVETANVSISTFGRHRVLVVERFDRRATEDGTGLLRLPQEDFCQVAGISPWLKYESDGGPGLRFLFETLRQSMAADRDARTVLAAQVLFWMLRAPDGHAKNFSLRIQPQGRFQLTPLYDVMSAYPVMGDRPGLWNERELKLAMALLGRNRHYFMHEVQRRHFTSTSERVGLGAAAEPLIEDILARTPGALAELRAGLPADFNVKVADTVLKGFEKSAEALSRMPPGELSR